jgi:hypothetical protein
MNIVGSRTRIEAALVAACSTLPVTAHADWQYTRWGMSPEQVAAASKGAAEVVKPKKKSDTIECRGTYSAGRFEFFVLFDFDPRSHGLQEVTLLYTGAKGPPVRELVQAMQEKYGMWSPNTVWLDKIGGYSVSLEESAELAFVHYRPLHETEKGGL